MSDIIISCGGTNFTLSRSRLKASSAVFEAMLLDTSATTITLHALPEVFQFYMESLEVNPTVYVPTTILVDLTKFCFQYDIPALLSICQDNLLAREEIPVLTKLTVADGCRLDLLLKHAITQLTRRDKMDLTGEEEKALLACRKETILAVTKGLYTGRKRDIDTVYNGFSGLIGCNSSYITSYDVEQRMDWVDERFGIQRKKRKTC